MTPILYLGPEGTYSHEAAIRRFGADAPLVPCLSHYDVFDRLCGPRARPRPLAIVPVENSSEGPVTQTLDQLAGYPAAKILEGFTLPICHHLVAGRGVRNLAAIKRVYSHPQALGQCRDTLRRLLPDADLQPESSTAAAARRAAAEPACAAIASAAAAQLNGLRILRRNLQDSDKNVTRFFVVSANPRAALPPPAKGRKPEMRSLIHLLIGNRPGALLHSLAPFDAAKVNLTFIQSRPLPGRPWEYGFFIEAATDWTSPAAEAAWRLVLALSDSGRKIGTYPMR